MLCENGYGAFILTPPAMFSPTIIAVPDLTTLGGAQLGLGKRGAELGIEGAQAPTEI